MNIIHELHQEVQKRLRNSLLQNGDNYIDDFYYVDQGIRPAIQLLNKNGFETFESCQGGEGHAFPEPTVRFYGSQMDCIRAYELCRLNGLNVFNARRVFAKEPLYNTNETKEIGSKWRAPFNELTFVIHSKTGTIFRPH